MFAAARAARRARDGKLDRQERHVAKFRDSWCMKRGSWFGREKAKLSAPRPCSNRVGEPCHDRTQSIRSAAAKRTEHIIPTTGAITRRKTPNMQRSTRSNDLNPAVVAGLVVLAIGVFFPSIIVAIVGIVVTIHRPDLAADRLQAAAFWLVLAFLCGEPLIGRARSSTR
jgi:hypothetical protein